MDWAILRQGGFQATYAAVHYPKLGDGAILIFQATYAAVHMLICSPFAWHFFQATYAAVHLFSPIFCI